MLCDCKLNIGADFYWMWPMIYLMIYAFYSMVKYYDIRLFIAVVVYILIVQPFEPSFLSGLTGILVILFGMYNFVSNFGFKVSGLAVVGLVVLYEILGCFKCFDLKKSGLIE